MAVTLNGTLANDDALQQTQVVNTSADITFLGSYGGVILTNWRSPCNGVGAPLLPVAQVPGGGTCVMAHRRW